jgi:putative FmdB family regulatory protein
MPIYEYVCPTCGQSFEKLVRGGRKAREAPVPCPTCGQDSRRKEVTLVSAVGVSNSGSLASSAAACAPSG